MSLALGQEIEVEIEKLVYGGSGLARHQGFVVFINYSSPGELCRVKITKVKKSFAEAEIVKSLKPGPYQLEAPCEVFSKCGACHWQTTDYVEQVRQKQRIAEESINKWYEKPIAMITKEPWHYRNRIQVRLKNNEIGFYKKSSHEIVDAKNCLTARRELLEKLADLPASIKETDKAIVHKFELYVDKTKKIQVSINKKHGEEVGFSQVNEAINDSLVDTVSTWINKRMPQYIYDLYCGKGNFSLALEDKATASQIIGVDVSEANISQAKLSTKRIQFVCAEVVSWLKSEPLKAESLVIVDPPRTGLNKDLIIQLTKSQPKYVVYISCNPSTLKRDLELWFNMNPNDHIAEINAFDMFPQTYHFEMALLLERK